MRRLACNVLSPATIRLARLDDGTLACSADQLSAQNTVELAEIHCALDQPNSRVDRSQRCQHLLLVSLLDLPLTGKLARHRSAHRPTKRTRMSDISRLFALGTLACIAVTNTPIS